ncbi:hypothetical protein ROHU_028359 [Labeo rohita]|uniref:Uncharacterized protein n=1 Tax=Labeo rohita TaxID=84645 RepID=A0A498MD79_LABRO|nr:hypothetical protein ROHU_028359 [Labeo rohita]
MPGPPRYPCGGWRFDPRCVLPNPTGRPGNTRGEARRPFFSPYLVLVPDPSSHGAGGLGLIPRPPESSLRGLAPREKPPLELSTHACGDPSSPGAGAANLPPCPPESSLRGAAASPETPTAAGRIRPGMYWYPDGGSPESGANSTKLGVPLDPEAAYQTPPAPSPYTPGGRRYGPQREIAPGLAEGLCGPAPGNQGSGLEGAAAVPTPARSGEPGLPGRNPYTFTGRTRASHT